MGYRQPKSTSGFSAIKMTLHHATLVAYARAMCQGLDASITNRYRVTCQNILTSIFLPLFPCHQEEKGFRGAIGRVRDESACSDVIGHERAQRTLQTHTFKNIQFYPCPIQHYGIWYDLLVMFWLSNKSCLALNFKHLALCVSYVYLS